MRVNKKIKYLLILIIALIIPLSVNAAYSVTSGSSQSAGQSYASLKYIGGSEVICTQFENGIPSSCSSSKKLSNAVNAGAGAIVEWRNAGNNYICAEKLLTKFMYNYHDASGREDVGMTKSWAKHCGTATVKTIYDRAVARYNNVANIPKVGLGSSSLNFTQSGNNFVATTTVNGGGYSVTCSTSHGSVSLSNGVATVTVPKSDYGTTITLTCKTYYSYYAPTTFYYGCGSGKQELISTSATTDTVYGTSDSISGSFANPDQYYLDLNGYLDGVQTGNIANYGTADIYINGTLVANDITDYYTKWPSGTRYEITDIKAANGKKYNGVYSGSIKGTIYSTTNVYLNFSSLGGLKIIKTNSNNDVLAQLSSNTTAKFKLFNNSNCSGSAIKNFNAGDTVSNLDPGTYYLQEYQSKKGYHLPQSGEKWYCDPVTITAGTTKEITVENKTECEYKFRSNMTMKERIDLYNLIKSNYSQNFNALLDMGNITSVDACKNIPITKAYTRSCLAATSFSDYSSDFSDTNLSMYTESEKYGSYTFCLISYKLENKLGQSTFNNIKTGQSIISTDNVVAVGTLNRVCYNFGDDDSVIPDLKLENYVEKDVSMDGVNLIKSQSLTGPKTNQVLSIQYTLPVMYASNKDGKVYYGYCPSGEYCKILGRGIVSKFNLEPSTYNMNFNVTLNDDKFGNLGPNSDCRYTVENELIDYKNKLSLEFRSVNTDSDALFLSKDGTNDRKIGANWSSKDDRDFVLKEKNNSYNKNNEEPLYKITLTPQEIKKIRENNKTKTYDDYNMTCVDGGTKCISNYLTCLQNERKLFIKERKNINDFKVNQIVCKY